MWLPLRYVYIYIYTYILWHSIWHSSWHTFRHSIWHSVWHYIWHVFWYPIHLTFWHFIFKCIWHCPVVSTIPSVIFVWQCSSPAGISWLGLVWQGVGVALRDVEIQRPWPCTILGSFYRIWSSFFEVKLPWANGIPPGCHRHETRHLHVGLRRCFRSLAGRDRGTAVISSDNPENRLIRLAINMIGANNWSDMIRLIDALVKYTCIREFLYLIEHFKELWVYDTRCCAERSNSGSKAWGP